MYRQLLNTTVTTHPLFQSSALPPPKFNPRPFPLHQKAISQLILVVSNLPSSLSPLLCQSHPRLSSGATEFVLPKGAAETDGEFQVSELFADAAAGAVGEGSECFAGEGDLFGGLEGGRAWDVGGADIIR